MIGLAICVIGLVRTPLVPHLIKSELPPELNIYWLYWLNLGATVLTYWLFAYRNCLLQAHQRLDLSSLVTIASSTVQYILQLAIMIWLKDYYFFVLVLLLGNVVNNILTAWVTKRKFPQYRPEGELDKGEISAVNGKIRDLFTA